MAMMIEPPTGSPSTIEMALATRRMRTSGLAKKRRKLIRGAKRDSPTRLFGRNRRSRAGAAVVFQGHVPGVPVYAAVPGAHPRGRAAYLRHFAERRGAHARVQP